jgi:effector-binding domain-containing protein
LKEKLSEQFQSKNTAMKILKKILVGIVILLVIVEITSLFLPKTVYVERSLVMNAPSGVIFKEINTVKDWQKWSAWFRLDPKMQMTYFGPESGSGAGYSWKSDNKNVGEGKMTITASGVDSILTSMDFGSHGSPTAVFKFSKEGAATRVVWRMKMELGMNPIAKIFSLFMDKMVGPDFDKGLHNLDSLSLLEAKTMASSPDSKKYEVQTTTVEPVQVMTVRKTCSLDSIGPYLGAMYGEIKAALSKQGITQSGPVFAIYHVYEPPQNIDFEAGIPCSKKGKSEGNVTAKELPKTNALLVDYYGPYDEGMKAAHDQIHEYIRTNGKEMSGPPWEVYVTDPMVEKDPAKLLTKIYYPVK